MVVGIKINFNVFGQIHHHQRLFTFIIFIKGSGISINSSTFCYFVYNQIDNKAYIFIKVMKKNILYRVLLNELVSVSYADKFLGSVDKWTAHTNKYLREDNSMPHRAFSIFLFNSQNKLLFQRRSNDKKTFPLCWTNTCCSHPNMIQFQNGVKQVEPVRAALHRALHRQLKMDLTQEKFYFVDKILYKAFGSEKQQFGEYEVDYVFLCKLNTTDVKYELVNDQVSEVQWVSRGQISSFVKSKIQQGCYFSPWFAKMQQHGLLQNWWAQVQKGNLADVGPQVDTKVRNYL